MRASTLATLDDVSIVPETVSPGATVVLSICTPTISGAAFGRRMGDEGVGSGVAAGEADGVTACALAVATGVIVAVAVGAALDC